jgi:hypothetical protein
MNNISGDQARVYKLKNLLVCAQMVAYLATLFAIHNRQGSGYVHSEKRITLRHSRWPRPSREIRLMIVMIGGSTIK